MRPSVLCCLAAVLAAPSPASAGSSDWFETEGARLRLLTIDEPTAEGTLRGALEIALAPGWKTYWADPGDAGIPPQIDVTGSTNVAAAELAFPAPQRFDDGYATWAGYAWPVSLPVTFRVEDPAHFSAIDASVLLGICDEVCVPVQARLSVNARDAAAEAATRDAVEAAFAQLPGPANSGFGVVAAMDKGETLEFRAKVPAEAGAVELFVKTPAGMKLGRPITGKTGAETMFSIPVEHRGGGAKPSAVDYTLVADRQAVSGRTPLD